MNEWGQWEMENEKPGAAKQGQYYYGVQLLNGTVVMFYADHVTIEPSGVLCAFRKTNGNFHITLAWLPGQWGHFWAASVHDGKPIAIDSVTGPNEQGQRVEAVPGAEKAAKKKGARAK